MKIELNYISKNVNEDFDAINNLDDYSFKNVSNDLIILGFTGSIGSGCSFLANGICNQKENDFLYLELSDIIKAKTSNNESSELEKLQLAGNSLRSAYGPGILAYYGMILIDRKLKESSKKYAGVIISGIKNVYEIEFLRNFREFTLFSIHADETTRKTRLIGKRVKCADDFHKIDSSDSMQKGRNGQQVKECNFLSDIIINNSENIIDRDTKKYINDKIIEKYIDVIMNKINRNERISFPPSVDEVYMSMAYGESLQSSCLKRKVGAIIARIDNYEQKFKSYNNKIERGFVISSGHNEVPPFVKTCIEDGGCNRDKIYSELKSNLTHCPQCGNPISENEEEIICSNCNIDIIEKYIKNPSSGKLLDMCKSLHAEENALMNLLKNSSSINDNTVLYTTTFPCNLCANKIAEVGIKTVVYAEPYPQEDAKKILESHGVKCKMFEGIKSKAFFDYFS